MLLAPLLARGGRLSACAQVLLLAAGRVLRRGGQGGAVVDAVGLGVVGGVWVPRRRHEDRVLRVGPLQQV